MSIARRVNHEDCTDIESCATHNQEGAADGWEQTTVTNRPIKNEVSFFHRSEAAYITGLDYLVSREERYGRLMSNGYYPLSNTTATRETTSVTHIHRILKNLELTLTDFKFSAKNPIVIFDFLIHLVEESDVL